MFALVSNDPMASRATSVRIVNHVHDRAKKEEIRLDHKHEKTQTLSLGTAVQPSTSNVLVISGGRAAVGDV